jgi:DNA-binding XRE family transcriptional regulator
VAWRGPFSMLAVGVSYPVCGSWTTARWPNLMTSMYGRLKEGRSDLRQRKYLTQRQLSSRTGLGYGTIIDIECLPHINPRASTLRRLATALDVPVAELFDALDDAPTPEQADSQEVDGEGVGAAPAQA